MVKKLKQIDTKKNIISSAVKVFAEKGKFGATMDEIAKVAGVNKALLYYYFRTKDGVYVEVLTTIVGKMKSYICNGFEKNTSNNCIDVVKSFARNHMMAFAKNSNFTKIIMEALVNEPIVLKDVLLKSNENSNLIMLNYIKQSINKKEIRNVNAEHLMTNIVGMNLIYFIGAPIAQALLGLNVFDNKKYLKERMNSIIDLLLHGIEKKGIK